MDAYTNSRQARFGPLHYTSEGYLAIKEYGLIGDGAGAALVGRDGAIPWLCAPRFDSPPLFCGLLDAQRGGAFTIAPERLDESRHYYLPDTVSWRPNCAGPTGSCGSPMRSPFAPAPI